MRISDWSADVCSVDLQGQVVRLLRRPDDEGDAGQGQSAGGQRAVEEGAGMNLLALASVLMLAAVPAVAQDAPGRTPIAEARSEEHTSELQSLMRISYAVFCLKKKTQKNLYQNR